MHFTSIYLCHSGFWQVADCFLTCPGWCSFQWTLPNWCHHHHLCHSGRSSAQSIPDLKKIWKQNHCIHFPLCLLSFFRQHVIFQLKWIIWKSYFKNGLCKCFFRKGTQCFLWKKSTQVSNIWRKCLFCIQRRRSEFIAKIENSVEAIRVEFNKLFPKVIRYQKFLILHSLS